MNISKLHIILDSGEQVELVTQDRFIRVRDLTKAMSDANAYLKIQAESLEKKIAELEAENLKLKNENQELLTCTWNSDNDVPVQEFKNPLP